MDGDEAREAKNGSLVEIEALPHVPVGFLVSREQFQRLDVAVGIHHAAIQHRGGFRRLAGMIADARDEIARQKPEGA
jgi:hypothetical protein